MQTTRRGGACLHLGRLMSSRRAKRVGELMKKEISDLIQRGIKDPRVGFVTVTEVEVTDDLSYARIFISVYGEDKEKSETLESLRRASGFIRSQLSKRIRLHHFPELKFLWDNSFEQGEKITRLLEEIENESRGERPRSNN